MSTRTISRVALTSSLRLARLPLDLAIAFLPAGGRQAARSAVDQADANVRALAAAILSDDVLREDAQRRYATTEARERLMCGGIPPRPPSAPTSAWRNATATRCAGTAPPTSELGLAARQPGSASSSGPDRLRKPSVSGSRPRARPSQPSSGRSRRRPRGPGSRRWIPWPRPSASGTRPWPRWMRPSAFRRPPSGSRKSARRTEDQPGRGRARGPSPLLLGGGQQ
jgi:hypothetical protein